MAPSTVFNRDTFIASTDVSKRLQVLSIDSSHNTSAQPEGQDVLKGLSMAPKALPPKYFYDQQGSQLFEKICNLPEYYPTRTEASILGAYASRITELTGGCELVELGSGSATKTRLLLDAYTSQNYPLHYVPIDVSGTMLQESSIKLLEDYPNLTIQGLISTYEPALQNLPKLQLPTRMVMFIGSTLGNLSPVESHQFLQTISDALTPGQFFLLGLDLQKDVEIVEAAYNDAQGVTAAFNLNMLQHLNNLYNGDFKLDNFRHIATYNTVDHQIEMYLESQQEQSVYLKRLDLTVKFQDGERLLTEISRKFSPQQMETQLAKHGFKLLQTFTDKRNWFGLMLAQKI
ncbi:MAG: L-histidine N(alpha)-methyltransferase [Cyanobacteria bacterium P01_D01_bin.156]